MIVITLRDIVEIVAWICIILCFVWLSGSKKKQNVEDKGNDSDEKS